MTSGRDLREARLALNISGQELADALCITPSGVTRLEGRNVLPETAARYRAALEDIKARRRSTAQSARAAAEALIGAGNALLATGHQLIGLGDV